MRAGRLQSGSDAHSRKRGPRGASAGHSEIGGLQTPRPGRTAAPGRRPPGRRRTTASAGGRAAPSPRPAPPRPRPSGSSARHPARRCPCRRQSRPARPGQRAGRSDRGPWPRPFSAPPATAGGRAAQSGPAWRAPRSLRQHRPRALRPGCGPSRPWRTPPTAPRGRVPPRWPRGRCWRCGGCRRRRAGRAGAGRRRRRRR
mmetsp:Transcript_96626/g.306614  ORF Transcript_96626/g.306614 Transcript_96626/m.306614 type:complete len:200 (-) Transcript_96626:92-691(-)